ncbi:MAG: sulfurtransferase TusA family protein [Treponemataceae bacterium]
METIDARGLACPAPVVKAKKALAKKSEFEILVSSDVAKENVRRFLESKGVKLEIKTIDDGYKIIATKN